VLATSWRPIMQTVFVFWLLLFPADVLGAMDQQTPGHSGENTKNDTNDGVSLMFGQELTHRSNGRHLTQEAMYKERTSGTCDDSGDGWGSVRSMAACEAGATIVDWTTMANAKASVYASKIIPEGCSFF